MRRAGVALLDSTHVCLRAGAGVWLSVHLRSHFRGEHVARGTLQSAFTLLPSPRAGGSREHAGVICLRGCMVDIHGPARAQTHPKPNTHAACSRRMVVWLKPHVWFAVVAHAGLT
jgi:hypothetical protein